MIWIIVAIVAVLVVIAGIYNSLVRAKVRVDEAWSDITVQMKRRADLIPNLINTVKGYAKHEKDVFENVTKARADTLSAQGPAEAAKAENGFQQALKSIFAVAEAYPELKAQEGFVNLQKELSDTEDKVAYSRQFYNSVVRDYNQKLVVFPSNMIGNILGFTQEKFFEAQESEREPVKVSFS